MRVNSRGHDARWHPLLVPRFVERPFGCGLQDSKFVLDKQNKHSTPRVHESCLTHAGAIPLFFSLSLSLSVSFSFSFLDVLLSTSCFTSSSRRRSDRGTLVPCNPREYTWWRCPRTQTTRTTKMIKRIYFIRHESFSKWIWMVINFFNNKLMKSWIFFLVD